MVKKKKSSFLEMKVDGEEWVSSKINYQFGGYDKKPVYQNIGNCHRILGKIDSDNSIEQYHFEFYFFSSQYDDVLRVSPVSRYNNFTPEVLLPFVDTIIFIYQGKNYFLADSLDSEIRLLDYGPNSIQFEFRMTLTESTNHNNRINLSNGQCNAKASY